MISTDVAFFIRDVSDRAEAYRRALTRDQRPPVLYHYTDQAGLLGILKKRQFWATDIRYLNDAKEFGFALNLLADAIRADPAVLRHPARPELRDEVVRPSRHSTAEGCS